MTTSYQPGVCNIGPAERRKRLLGGYFGLIVTVITLGAFVAYEVPDLLRVLVALPAGLAANGFLQSAMHFCVGFAMRGLYNLGNLGEEKSVLEKEQRRADQRKGLLIMFYSGLIAAATVAIAVLLP